MISLTTAGDYALVFLVAGLAGLCGGLASELLLNHNGETGEFQVPSRNGGFIDLGGFATLIVGAVVGVAILIVYPPQTTIVTSGAGGSTISQSYDVVRLVATSLVAGSAGGSVLTALQARVVAAVNESRVQFALAAGQQQVDQVAQQAKDQLATAVSQLAAANPPGAAAGGAVARGALTDPTPTGAPVVDSDALIATLQKTIDDQAARSRAALASLINPPTS